MRQCPIDPILILLVICIIFFTIVLLFANNSQMFTMVGGILTGFVGAFLMRINPDGSKRE
jgi:uncharacterized membrane protein